MTFAGTWTKIDSAECDRQYPEEIEFRDATYLARKGPGQSFVIWDAGGYEVVGPEEVKIEIATDEQVRYRFSLAGDMLTFRDREGCEFHYRRSSRT
jgi:hypothetical protein